MEYQLSRGMRAPIEQIYRALIKNHFLNEEPRPPVLPVGRFGTERVLPPYLGEMGAEIRYYIARVEPWLNAGWKVVTRRPALYPEGSTVDAPGYFDEVDTVMASVGALGSHGGLHIPPLEFGQLGLERRFEGLQGNITLSLSDVTKITKQAIVEIELRKLFLKWFHFEGRPITEVDRYNLSFASTAMGNWEYHLGTALRPNFLPPGYVAPPEPVAPHVGVQMRNVSKGLTQEPRNSDPARMIALAREAGAHLGLPVVVYGHPDGCILPDDAQCTWDETRPAGHMARELGYLTSCRLMLAPDSGWADLMAWLMVPTLLERVYVKGAFEPLRVAFGGKLMAVDPVRPLAAQVDALLAAEGSVLPEPPDQLAVDSRLFPWEP